MKSYSLLLKLLGPCFSDRRKGYLPKKASHVLLGAEVRVLRLHKSFDEAHLVAEWSSFNRPYSKSRKSLWWQQSPYSFPSLWILENFLLRERQRRRVCETKERQRRRVGETRQLVFYLRVIVGIYSSAWADAVRSILHLSFFSFAPNSQKGALTTCSYKYIALSQPSLTSTQPIRKHSYTLSQPSLLLTKRTGKPTSYVLLPVRSIASSDYGPPINRGLGLWSSHMKDFLERHKQINWNLCLQLIRKYSHGRHVNLLKNQVYFSQH